MVIFELVIFGLNVGLLFFIFYLMLCELETFKLGCTVHLWKELFDKYIWEMLVFNGQFNRKLRIGFCARENYFSKKATSMNLYGNEH